MARPAIIIGVGGTGQWVATYVKRDLLEANYGEWPDNVKLLVFDTEVLPTAAAASGAGDSAKVSVGGREVDSKTYQELFGRVKLDEKEYKHLGDDVRKYSDAIIEGAHPHVAQWFDAKWFKNNQPETIFMLREGAAAWRQFGRLAAFYDLRNLHSSKIWNELRRAFDDISRADKKIGAERVVQVMIVTSIVGGTGAGMAMDIANVVREAASGIPIALRGVFVLPRAFGTWQERDEDSKKKRARAFATWRELDRFRLLGGSIGGLPIKYSSSFERELDRPLFDAVYMIDGTRQDGVQLTPVGRPEFNVYPMLADFVSVVLDEQAGQEFSAVQINLAASDDTPHVPKYSSIGAYSLKSPVYYVMQEQTHRFAQTFLAEWLQITTDPKNKERFLMAPNQNLEGNSYQGKRGRDVVLDFLATDTIRWKAPDGTVYEASSTYFPGEIHRVLTTFQGNQFDIEERFILGAGREEWWDVFTDLRTSDTNALQDELYDALDIRLDARAPSSKSMNEDPAFAPARLIGPQGAVPEFIREIVGGFSEITGKDETGKYGQGLDRVRERQVERFGQTIRVWLLKTLMGDTTDVRQGKTGKVGFAIDFLDGMVVAFDKYLKFLDRIETERRRMGIATEMVREADHAEAMMLRHANDRWPVFNSPRPRAYKHQETYLEIKQEQIDVRKDDIFYRALRLTTEEMLDIVKSARQSFTNLSEILIGNPDLGYTGIYRELDSNLDQVSTGRSRESNDLGAIQKVYQLQLDNKVRDQLLDHALSNIEWKVESTQEGLAVQCVLHPFSADENKKAITLPDEEYRYSHEYVQDLLAFSQNAYEGVWAANRIAQVLKDQYGKNYAAQLASELNQKANPLYELSGRGQTGAKSLRQWMRVQTVGDTEESFFDEVRNELQSLDNTVNMSRRLESEDPYRLTIVRTDDLIPSVSFQEYETSMKQYQELAQEYTRVHGAETAGRLLHSFPAEGNALRFEMELYRLFEVYRPLHPLVVAGLEHVDRAADFFWAYLLDYVRLEEGRFGSATHYVLQIPYLKRDRSLDDELRPALTLATSNSTELNGEGFLRALANYVAFGGDMNSSARINHKRVRDVLSATLEVSDPDKIRQQIFCLIDEKQEGLIRHLREEAHRSRQDENDGGRQRSEQYSIAQAYDDLANMIVLLFIQSANEFRMDLQLGKSGRRDNRLRELLFVPRS